MIKQIPPFEKAKVLVVGDVMLDRYWYGDVHRISPEAPVPVVGVNSSEDRPGGAANVALNCNDLGATVTLIGCIGCDLNGDLLLRSLESTRIKPVMYRDASLSTITKLRVIGLHQQLMRLDFEKPRYQIPTSWLLSTFEAHVKESDIVILSDYAKGTLIDSLKLIEIANRYDKPILVDPKSKDFSCYKGATIITPNRGELELVVGTWRSEEELETSVHALMESIQIQALLVTRGEHGMSLFLSKQKSGLHLPAHSHEVYDVTGAGDTVIAVLASSLAIDIPIEEAVELANLGASIVVEKLGAATVTPYELRRTLYQLHGAWHGMLTEDELCKAVNSARQLGEKIVFTNGCFDILHVGHVNYLSQAKKLGDRLIVAVNDDHSVKRLKGSLRPINSLEKRVSVLSALSSVDWVIPFSDDTPERLLHMLRPNVLVKGGDYQLHEVVGANVVHSYGGEVKVLAHHPNVSTTLLLNQIKTQELTGLEEA